MTNIHFVPQNIGEDDLGEIFFPLISIKRSIFELLTYMSHLAIDALLLELSNTTCSKVRDILTIYVSSVGRVRSCIAGDSIQLLRDLGTYLCQTSHGARHRG